MYYNYETFRVISLHISVYMVIDRELHVQYRYVMHFGHNSHQGVYS